MVDPGEVIVQQHIWILDACYRQCNATSGMLAHTPCQVCSPQTKALLIAGTAVAAQGYPRQCPQQAAAGCVSSSDESTLGVTQ